MKLSSRVAALMVGVEEEQQQLLLLSRAAMVIVLGVATVSLVEAGTVFFFKGRLLTCAVSSPSSFSISFLRTLLSSSLRRPGAGRPQSCMVLSQYLQQ